MANASLSRHSSGTRRKVLTSGPVSRYTNPVMSYLRKDTKHGTTYYYICKSIRRGDRVTSKVLEYLGRDPDPKRLKKAMEYWDVKKPKKTKGRR